MRTQATTVPPIRQGIVRARCLLLTSHDQHGMAARAGSRGCAWPGVFHFCLLRLVTSERLGQPRLPAPFCQRSPQAGARNKYVLIYLNCPDKRFLSNSFSFQSFHILFKGKVLKNFLSQRTQKKPSNNIESGQTKYMHLYFDQKSIFVKI